MKSPSFFLFFSGITAVLKTVYEEGVPPASLHKAKSVDFLERLVLDNGLDSISYPQPNGPNKELQFGIESLPPQIAGVHYQRGRKQIADFVSAAQQEVRASGYTPSLQSYFRSIRKSNEYPVTYLENLEPFFAKYDFYDMPPLGAGTFGSVFYATSASTRGMKGSQKLEMGMDVSKDIMKDVAEEGLHREYAIKIQACTSETNKLHFGNEVSVHWGVGGYGKKSHPNIAKLFEVFVADDYMILVQEHIHGKSLYSLVEHNFMPEVKVVHLFKQLNLAMLHIHSCGAAHRDLKPENIMVSAAGVLKVIDFGLGVWGRLNPIQDSSSGSPEYVSPEILNYFPGEKLFLEGKLTEEELRNRYMYSTASADLWAMGVTLYTVVTRTLPFDEPTVLKLFQKIKAASYSIPHFVPSHVKKIIGIYLTKDWEKREKLVRQGVPWPVPGASGYRPYSAEERKALALPPLSQDISRNPFTRLEVPVRTVRRSDSSAAAGSGVGRSASLSRFHLMTDDVEVGAWDTKRIAGKV